MLEDILFRDMETVLTLITKRAGKQAKASQLLSGRRCK